MAPRPLPAAEHNPCHIGRRADSSVAGQTEAMVWRMAKNRCETGFSNGPIAGDNEEGVSGGPAKLRFKQILYMGNIAIDRRSPDYYALNVLNRVLGGSAAARLFMNLRENKGYTYGAYSGFAAVKLCRGMEHQ